jgi:Fe-S-cluster containining protein
MTYDCQACGACCAFGLDIPLMGNDAQRFEADPRLFALTLPQLAAPGWELRFMRTDEAGRCVALAGPLGRCDCTIYPDRPLLCRELQPGMDHCLQARRAHGFPVDDAPPAASATDPAPQ